jgi:hypothetical protein
VSEIERLEKELAGLEAADRASMASGGHRYHTSRRSLIERIVQARSRKQIEESGLEDQEIPEAVGKLCLTDEPETVEEALAVIRLVLYSAMQILQGENLARFWELIEELHRLRPQ